MHDAPIIVVMGLGNPGTEYENTRHNVGFAVIDKLLDSLPDAEKMFHKFNSHISVARFAGRHVWLVKPQTYMNLSGQAAAAIVRHLGLTPNQLLVVYDCMDLPLGRFRLRRSGSGGGQRGMDSVIQSLGTRDIPRLRVGIGRGIGAGATNHVLSTWTDAENALLSEVIAAAVDAVHCTLKTGISRAMNAFNGWIPAEERAQGGTETGGCLDGEKQKPPSEFRENSI